MRFSWMSGGLVVVLLSAACSAGPTERDINDSLDANPAQVNNDPYGDGWMIQIRASNPAELESLLDAAAYERLIGNS